MVSKLSYILAERIAIITDRNDADYIRYGLEVVISTISKIIFFIFISLFFDVTAEMLTIALAFGLFRLFSGGVHLSTYLRCLISSTILFLFPAILLNNINIFDYNLIIIISAFIIGIVTTLFYVPVSATNRPISKNLNMKFKVRSISFLSIWFIINLIVYKFTSYSSIVLSLSLGIIIQSFTLTPIGWKIFHNIDLILNKIRKEKSNEKSI